MLSFVKHLFWSRDACDTRDSSIHLLINLVIQQILWACYIAGKF